MARDQTELLEMGERIADLRRATGLKQQYIADYCGVQLRTYQFWQQGKHPPEQESLEKLAELFGVTTKYILKGHTPDLFGPGESKIADQLSAINSRLNRLQAVLEELAGRKVVEAALRALDQEDESDSSERPPRAA